MEKGTIYVISLLLGGLILGTGKYKDIHKEIFGRKDEKTINYDDSSINTPQSAFKGNMSNTPQNVPNNINMQDPNNQNINDQNEPAEPTTQICPICHGVGECDICNGMGYCEMYGVTSVCTACNGTGKCWKCGGTGYVIK